MVSQATAHSAVRRGKMTYLGALEGEEGISLVILTIMIVLIGITAVGVVVFLGQNIALSSMERDRTRALCLAEMGMADSFWELRYSEKLYGAPSQPYGEIDAQTVSFGDGTSGTYAVSEPDDSIVSTGVYNGITRQVKVGIENLTDIYAFFAASPGDFTFNKNCQVVGNCFVNGSVTVRTPTNIDTLEITLYLPPGETATYQGGGAFPFTTVDPAPSLSGLNLTYYDSLLSSAASQPSGDSVWSSDRVLPDVVLIDGDLNMRKNISISTAGSFSLVVANGQITIGKNVNIADSIQFIAKLGVNCNANVRVGSTTGRSGNSLFTRSGLLKLGKNNVVNGSLLSNKAVQINQGSEMNGLVYGGTESTVQKNVTISGCFWGHGFSNDRINDGCRVIWKPEYVPSPLPPGVSGMGSSSISFVQNSWREL